MYDSAVWHFRLCVFCWTIFMVVIVTKVKEFRFPNAWNDAVDFWDVLGKACFINTEVS